MIYSATNRKKAREPAIHRRNRQPRFQRRVQAQVLDKRRKRLSRNQELSWNDRRDDAFRKQELSRECHTRWQFKVRFDFEQAVKTISINLSTWRQPVILQCFIRLKYSRTYRRESAYWKSRDPVHRIGRKWLNPKTKLQREDWDQLLKGGDESRTSRHWQRRGSEPNTLGISTFEMNSRHETGKTATRLRFAFGQALEVMVVIPLFEKIHDHVSWSGWKLWAVSQ